MGRPKAPLARLVIAILLSTYFALAPTANPALAQSSSVTANIPAGYILVQGKTSPNAQVKMYENGNEQPAVSIIADASGLFSEELPQDSPGLVDIGVQATDTSNKKSALITKQVAVIAQQTSTLTVILPPTITATPSSVVFRSGTLNFSGQTLPNATVKVRIEPSTILTATSDSQGNYAIPLLVESLKSVGTYTFGVEVTVGTEMSDYVIAGTFIVTPPIQQPVSPPGQPLLQIVNVISNQPLAPPEITYPSEDEYRASEPFVITGRSSAGALINLYDNNVIIGTVVTREDETWQFYFSPYKELHTLHAEACLNGKCSDKSRTVTIRQSESGANLPCRLGISLKEYRLTTKVGDKTELSGSIPQGGEGTLHISWGDETNEHFDTDPSRQLEATHTYDEAGTYSGYVMLSDNRNCQTATYFAVEVSKAESVAPIVILAMILLLGAAIIKRFGPHLIRSVNHSQ